MRASVIVAGIIVIVIGIIVSALQYSGQLLFAGIGLLVVGVAITIAGSLIGKPERVESAIAQPKQREFAVTAKKTGNGPEVMESMVRMLAQAPEEQRREMIKTRLASFASMNDNDRANAMRAMINAMQKLDQESISKLAYTRLESLAEDFDAPTRKKLMGTHMIVLSTLSKEEMMKDINSMLSAMVRCHDACKTKDMQTMKELMMEMPQEKRSMMMQMLPPDVRKMLM